LTRNGKGRASGIDNIRSRTGFAFAYYSVDTIFIVVEIIKAFFILQDQEYRETGSYDDREAADVDNGRIPLAPQISQCGLKIVSDHRKAFEDDDTGIPSLLQYSAHFVSRLTLKYL
jgi:hypothetical protein